MSEKRFYWLKLRKDFFNDLRQKKLRRQKDGIFFQVVYLKLMLLSMDQEGIIPYQGVYDSIEEEISEQIGEELDVVTSALDYFRRSELVIDEDSYIFIPETCECVGSEGASAARNRDMRNRRKAEKEQESSQCDAGVTERDGDVTARDTEKSREEREIDVERESEWRKGESEGGNKQPTLSNADQVIALFNSIFNSNITRESLSKVDYGVLSKVSFCYPLETFEKAFRFAFDKSKGNPECFMQIINPNLLKQIAESTL